MTSLSQLPPGPILAAAAGGVADSGVQTVASNAAGATSTTSTTGTTHPARQARSAASTDDAAELPSPDTRLRSLFADTLRALGLPGLVAEGMPSAVEEPALPEADGGLRSDAVPLADAGPQAGLPAPATPEASFAMVAPTSSAAPFVPPPLPTDAATLASGTATAPAIAVAATPIAATALASIAKTQAGHPTRLATPHAAAQAEAQAALSAGAAVTAPALAPALATSVTSSTGAAPIAPASQSATPFALAAPAPTQPGEAAASAAPQAGADSGAIASTGAEAMPARPGVASPPSDTVVMAHPIRLAPTATPPEQRQALATALGERLQVQIAQRSEHAVIRIEPPRMGSIEIAIRHEAGSLQVHLNASHGEVQRQLQQIGDTLKQELAQRHAGDVSVQVGGEPRDGDGRQRPRHAAPDTPTTPGRALAEAQGDTSGAAARFALSSHDLN